MNEAELSAREGLPPLPEYTCGQCFEMFGSNCRDDDISCAYCGAKRCPHCREWFGGDNS
jgi:hypothetical protein